MTGRTVSNASTSILLMAPIAGRACGVGLLPTAASSSKNARYFM